MTKIRRARDQRRPRVAAYCRVSTMLEQQEGSLRTQIDHYRELIEGNPNWDFAGIYTDEKSGTAAKNRPGFQRLMADARKGKIDLILVKSVSRFARNLVDSEAAIRQLRACGVWVHFEREGIRTEDPSSGMILSLMAAIAQDESKSISENVRWSYAQRCRRGEHNLGSNRVLGYDCVDGKLTPNGDSYLISEIFSQFSQGRTPTQIARSLNARGLTGLRGRPFSAPAIRYILQNEIYAGDRLLQKRPPRNFLTGHPDPSLPHDPIYLPNDHAPIIPRPLWEEVQRRLGKKSAP